MSNKFTEKQYQKIVDITDEYIKKSGWGLIGTHPDEPIGSIFEGTNLIFQVNFSDINQEMMAMANPLTREWAHDKFVEKEKKYYWFLKNYEKTIRLVKVHINNMITTSESDPTALTEVEVKRLGYNPVMFDKEEG